jgi:hypothetical protein
MSPCYSLTRTGEKPPLTRAFSGSEIGSRVPESLVLENIDAPTYVVSAGTAVLTVKPESAQPDKMSDDEGSGDQEGSDEGASAGFHGDGHPSV